MFVIAFVVVDWSIYQIIIHSHFFVTGKYLHFGYFFGFGAL